MSEYSGVIQKHFEKAWQDKTFWSFTLSGQDGFFSLGVKKPPAVGTSVKFEAEEDAKGRRQAKNLAVQKDGEPTTASVKAAGKSVAEKDYWARKEAREVQKDENYQLGASRNTALNIIDLMIRNEAIKLPAVSKREAFIRDLINHYTALVMGKGLKVDEQPSAVDVQEAVAAAKAADVTEEDEDWN